MPLRRRPRESKRDPKPQEFTFSTGAQTPKEPRVVTRRPPGKK